VIWLVVGGNHSYDIFYPKYEHIEGVGRPAGRDFDSKGTTIQFQSLRHPPSSVENEREESKQVKSD
jgi:hypothetical protein